MWSNSSIGKESACNAGDPGLIPGSGRSPGEGNSYPLQDSSLENSMDCIVHGVAMRQTGLSDFHFHFQCSLQKSQFFASGGPSTGASASELVLPMNIQDWFPLGWTGLISLKSKGLSRVFSNTTVQKHQVFSAQLSSQSNSHIHTWPLEKT